MYSFSKLLKFIKTESLGLFSSVSPKKLGHMKCRRMSKTGNKKKFQGHTFLPLNFLLV